MGTYQYIAYDAKGRRRKGLVEATSREAAIARLKREGFFPEEVVALTQKQEKKGRRILSLFWKRVRDTDRADMFFQLATLVSSGVSLTQALGIVAEQMENRALKRCLSVVRDRVLEGRRFSEALKDFQDMVGVEYVGMVEIAEKTGRLGEILFKIAEREEKKGTFNQKVAAALAYPAFVLVAGIFVVTFLLAYVIPKIQRIFASFHRDLPVITKLLIYVSEMVRSYLPLMLIVAVVFLFLYRLLLVKVESVRRFQDDMLLKVKLYRKILIFRFVSALSFQIESGIPLVDAIKNSLSVINNVVFADEVMRVVDWIETGGALDKGFEESGLFEPIFIASIAVGQRSGELGRFLKRLSQYYEKRLGYYIDTFVSLVEPAAVLVLGSIVGFIVMAIMIPIFNINQLVR